MRRSDNLTDAIRDAVFALKQGEVSSPVRQPNGFYIFKAEEVGYRPQSGVRDEIQRPQTRMHQHWIKETDAGVKVRIVKQDFFKPPPAPADRPAAREIVTTPAGDSPSCRRAGASSTPRSRPTAGIALPAGRSYVVHSFTSVS
jgi:hypothetical protein